MSRPLPDMFPVPLPVSVLVATRNEAARIGACLDALCVFDDVVVVDSDSTDQTVRIAREKGARVIPFIWNGHYPKKRQWCLETLDLKYDWVFFVDADEYVTPDLVQDIERVLGATPPPQEAGFFVEGQYLWKGRLLQHGFSNNKIALLDRRKMAFPQVGDLEIPGMGEMEGHYQPIVKPAFANARIGRLRGAMIHDAAQGWEARHVRYALWESGMNAGNLWPRDPVPWREQAKRLFRACPWRGVISFLYGYVWKAGFLDGWQGLDFALCRARYYRMISDASKGQETNAAPSRPPPDLP